MVTLRAQNSGPFPLRDVCSNGEPSPHSGVQPVDHLARIQGSSAALVEAVQRARLFANVTTPLLLHGETGSGKAMFARAIHESGLQRQGPFVSINCGGLPHDALANELFGQTEANFTGTRRASSTGKIEAAHGGTLFLDEIAELPLDLQAYFLRILESGEVCPLGSNRARSVRFRLIASSNRELRREVKRGRFRTDLFYRISVTSLAIPALRERTDDLAELVAHFADDAAERLALPRKAFAPAVLAAFARYAWPGNVRELRNVVEALVLTSAASADDSIGVDMLPPELFGKPGEPARDATPGALYLGVEQLEYTSIGAAIRKYEGNLTQAAKALRIARSTLYLKMKKYSLELVRDEVRYGTR
jgi:transcriptional regulator with PAS, ATPase and Fis domain